MALAVLTGALVWPPVGSGQEPTRVSFRPPHAYPTDGGFPAALAVGDLNGDGDLDLAVGKGPPADGNGGRVAVLLGAKAGLFSAPVGQSAGTGVTGVTTAVLEPQKTGAVVTADPAGALQVLAVRTGPSGVSLDQPVRYLTGGDGPVAVAAADIDGNGTADLLAANQKSDELSVLFADTDGRFGEPVVVGAGGDPAALVVADLIPTPENGAAEPEIAVANRAGGGVSILRRTAGGNFERADHQVGGAPSAMAAADVNRDGRPDLLVADGAARSVTVLAGQPDGTFAVQGEPRPVGGAGSETLTGMAVGDFDGDDDPDLAVSTTGQDTISLLLGKADFGFSASIPVPYGPAPTGGRGANAVVAGDFDGDGDADLAAARAGVAEVAVVLNNAVPTAVNDRYLPDEDTPFSREAANGVLENDVAEPDDELKVTLQRAPRGTLALQSDGAFEYTPPKDFAGTDSFAYTVTDDGGATSAPATVELVVTPVNDAPVAKSQLIVTTKEDSPVPVPVAANYTDVEGDPVTVVNAASTGGGAVDCDDTTCVFSPGPNYEGPAAFDYTVTDGQGAATGKAQITVQSVPDDPKANDDHETTAEDTPTTFEVLVNDVEVDSGDSLEIPSGSNTAPRATSEPAPLLEGAAFCSGTTCTYTPPFNFSGVETFTYTVEDTTGRKSTATVTMTVTSQNEIPEAREDKYPAKEDSTVAVNAQSGVLANDEDGDRDPLEAILVRGPTPPAEFALAPDGSFTYTPPPNFSGTDSFTYQAYDGKSDSAPATVTITIAEVNDPPVAEPDATTTVSGRPVEVKVGANDADGDGDPLKFSVQTPPVHGRVDCKEDACTYRPVAHYVGDDRFTYTVSDGRGGSDSVDVTITVFPAGPRGYWLLDAEGSLYAFGPAADIGDPTGHLDGARAVDLEPSPSGNGYWVLDHTGGVHAFGDAAALGSVDPFTLGVGDEARALALTASGAGYWVVTAAGRVYPFGDAPDVGDLRDRPPSGPILDAAATPNGAGYYLVATDGEVYAFGNAGHAGSLAGQPLNSPVVSIAADPDGSGYWLTAADGGVFSFGAPFLGSMAATPLNGAVAAISAYGNGYMLVAEDGGVFVFSDRPFHGSLGAAPPARPVTSGVIF